MIIYRARKKNKKFIKYIKHIKKRQIAFNVPLKSYIPTYKHKFMCVYAFVMEANGIERYIFGTGDI